MADWELLYETACTGAVRFDLSAHSKIELSGPDARLFLHNLCTNDVKNLAVGAGCEAFLTTAKARVVGHVFVGHFRVQGQEVLWLDTVPGQADVLTRHLNHYIVSEQVEVVDRTAVLSMHRFAGPNAQTVLEAWCHGSLAELKNLSHVAIVMPEGATAYVRRFDGLSVPAFDVFTEATNWTNKLEVPEADLSVHECLRIEGGLPAFGADVDETRLVMEVGRKSEAICYTKGCFLGQEPIVMARDRGQVKRALAGVKLSTRQPLAHGTRLLKGEVEAGQVTSSVYSPRLQQVIGLAYLNRGYQETGLELAAGSGPAVVAALPFISPLANPSSRA